MATKKEKQKASIVGAVLLAVIIGLVLGAVMFHDSGTPMPPPANVEFSDPYDDSWGKLDSPVARCGVSHVLVKIDDKRTDEEAKKLIDQIWHKYRNEPTKENWKKLQTEYNEDVADKYKVFPIPGNLVPEFMETGKSTKVGFARIAKTSYGYHLIRREN